MKSLTFPLVVGAAFVAASCIPSLQPLYTDKTTTFEPALVGGLTGYECPNCHAMQLEFCLRDAHVYRQFQPMEVSSGAREQRPHALMPAA